MNISADLVTIDKKLEETFERRKISLDNTVVIKETVVKPIQKSY